jgi:hypothetical protein
MEGSKIPETGTGRHLRTGYIVFSILVSIKIGEYILSRTVHTGVWAYLLILALASAWLIVYFYKHISQLWRSGDKNNG